MAINPVNLSSGDGGIAVMAKTNDDDLAALKSNQPTSAAINQPSLAQITSTVDISTHFTAAFGFMLQELNPTTDALMSDFHFSFSFSPNVSGDDETGIGVTLFQDTNVSGGQSIRGLIEYSQPYVSSTASQQISITARGVYGLDPNQVSFTIWRGM